MGYETFISTRYLRSKKKEVFLSLTTYISIGGVAIGVMALVVVLAVMTGAEQSMQEMILGSTAHVTVMQHGGTMENWERAQKRIQEVEEVTATAPYVQAQVMIRGPRGGSGAVLKGVVPDQTKKVLRMSADAAYALEALTRNRPENSRPPIVLGKDLADSIGARPGDVVSVIAPQGTLTPLGSMPRIKRFELVERLKSGWYEYDSAFAWCTLEDGQNLARVGEGITGLEVAVTDAFVSSQVADKISLELGFPYWAQDWTRVFEGLLKALKLEKLAMFVILMFIVLVAAFNIASTLIMMVMEKKKDIAILKAMGATRKSIRRIFVGNGLVIGSVGTGLGVSLGWLLCFLQETFQVVRLDARVYPFGFLPVQVDALDVVVICVASMVVCLLATLYPAWSASRLDPVETIRYG